MNEIPDGVVRTRAGGTAWRSADLTPLQEIDLLLRELGELDPDYGRQPIRWRCAVKMNRIISLVAQLGLNDDDEIVVAIHAALRQRASTWDPLALREILVYMRDAAAR